MNDLEKKSIECIKNMPIEETTYQVARNVVLDYITNLQQENEIVHKDFEKLSQRYFFTKSGIEKAVEYIKKDTRWFDSEYAKVYGELCTCAGANANRLEVLVNPSNLLNILNGRSDE